MKKTVLITACILITLKLAAQDCNNFYYMQKNKTIEFSAFDENGKFLRKSISKVSDLSTADGAVTAKVVTQAIDKNGKAGSQSTMFYKCNGGVLSVSMNFDDSKKPNSSASKNSINFTYLAYPSGMKVGDHLKDATSQLTENLGTETITATSKITDRMVVAKETITTTAGSWSCLKITYKTTVTLGGKYSKMAPQTMESTEWYVPGFGIVKTELFGMIMELTKLS
jgi:hypothetical protein